MAYCSQVRHRHFSKYYKRFKYEKTDVEYVYRQRQAQLYPFSYSKVREHRLHLWYKNCQRQLSPEKVLKTSEGVTVFAKRALTTGLFYQRYSGLNVFSKKEDNGG